MLRSNICFVPIVRFVHTALFLQNVACALYSTATNHADTLLALCRLLGEHRIDLSGKSQKASRQSRIAMRDAENCRAVPMYAQADLGDSHILEAARSILSGPREFKTQSK
ncbi:hypothetical protein IscW_ISCW007553 [Ixodes scapularis]|uniref:Secreted protein n=1 Tax=Ixodes scapularis TaxID=6945 RepID=B7PUH3_IXOSC|nr:hypothetical protein IscW_ISCW007553 [Ixodes scapularis]|eukprot:XP_002406067.1 hypothetical protein IscW_ISCW007553 [Ixodes scapularis]